MDEPSISEPEGAEDRVRTQRAGLVLLWPFLERLFETLDAVDRPGRRVRLLSYLGNGSDGSTDADPLEALLAGVDPGLTLDGEPLSTKDEDLCDQMLGAVRQNWPALADTSTEGLRETFLLRDGVLSQFVDRHHLVVDGGPFDLLLDRLPWQISAIRLDWMPKPLMVNWR